MKIKNLVIIFLMLIISINFVFGECYLDNSWSGTVELTGDEICTDENHPVFEITDITTVNCNGYTIGCYECYSLFDIQMAYDLTLNDCVLEMFEATGDPYFILDGNDADLSIYNSTIRFNGSVFLQVESYGEDTGRINLYNNIIENHPYYDSPLDFILIFDGGGQDITVNFTENKFYEIGNGDYGYILNSAILGFNMSDSTGIGNYYNMSSYNCTDSDMDGICENAYNSNGVYDNYPLSSPAPYIPPVITCGENLASGTYTLNSDLDCPTGRAFDIVSNDNVVVDCGGYTVYGNSIEVGEVSNIEIKNCVFDMNYSGHSEVFNLYPYNMSFHHNTIICYNVSGTSDNECINIEGWEDAENWGMKINMSYNDFTYYTVDDQFMSVYLEFPSYPDMSTWDFVFSHNNITTNATYVYKWWDYYAQDTLNLTETSSFNFGNYYTHSSYTCTDSDFDGVCENAFTEINPNENGTVIDQFPLSQYYWTPYIPPPETELTGCIEINDSGDYYLSGDIDATSWTGNLGYCLDIENDNINIDCRGNSILGNSNSLWYIGVYINGYENLTVYNCTFDGGAFGLYSYGSGTSVDSYDNNFDNIVDSAVVFEGGTMEVRNSTFNSVDVAVRVDHASVDNEDILTKHNNFIDVNKPVDYREGTFSNIKGKLDIYSNYYNVEGACVDSDEDGDCDYSYGTDKFTDATPERCIDGWKGGLTGCISIKYQYNSGDISTITIDGIGKFLLVFVSLAGVIAFVGVVGYLRTGKFNFKFK